LLTAFCDKEYAQEQQAMTLALQCFHQTPTLKTQIGLPGIITPVDEEFVITMEMETSDELSRFWQAVTVPFRLSAVYKVTVVLLTPPAAPSLPQPVQSVQLVANPTIFPFISSGQIVGTLRKFSFATPISTAAAPEVMTVDYSPAVVAPGQRFILYGVGLNQGGPAPAPATSDRVFLIMPDGTSHDVTNHWKTHTGDPHEADFQTDSHMTLDLPATIGAVPAHAPPPGVYQLCAGGATNRTNATPFSVAARIDVPVIPPNPPLLHSVGGNYALHGEGFVAARTQVLLETIVLEENSAGPPLDGQFTVGSSHDIAFRPPTGLTPGNYAVRIRVNGVESPPSWWIAA
jgi:hypothetical protein